MAIAGESCDIKKGSTNQSGADGQEGLPASNSTTGFTIESAKVIDVDLSIDKLKQYLDGERLIVNYYNNIVTKDDFQIGLDTGVDVTDITYLKIIRALLMVQSPLETKGDMKELTFTAIIPREVHPMIGDICTFRIVSGELAMFTITDIETKNYNLDPIYEATFKIDTIVTKETDRFRELEERVIRVIRYVEGNYLHENAGYITDDRYNIYEAVENTIDILSEEYVKRHKRPNNYLAVMYKDISIFDPYITNFFNMVSDRKDYAAYVDIDLGGTLLESLLHKGKPYTNKGMHLKIVGSRLNPNVSVRTNLPKSLGYIVTNTPTTQPLNIPEIETMFLTPNSYGTNKYLNFKQPLASLVDNVIKGESIPDEGIKFIIDNYHKACSIDSYWVYPIFIFLLKVYKSNMYNRELV